MFWWPWWIDKPLENKSKDQDNITLVYAGFGDECKVEDLDSLRTYKFRLTVEIDGSKISTSSDWISITTNKEPFRYKSLMISYGPYEMDFPPKSWILMQKWPLFQGDTPLITMDRMLFAG